MIEADPEPARKSELLFFHSTADAKGTTAGNQQAEQAKTIKTQRGHGSGTGTWPWRGYGHTIAAERKRLYIRRAAVIELQPHFQVAGNSTKSSGRAIDLDSTGVSRGGSTEAGADAALARHQVTAYRVDDTDSGYATVVGIASEAAIAVKVDTDSRTLRCRIAYRYRAEVQRRRAQSEFDIGTCDTCCSYQAYEDDSSEQIHGYSPEIVFLGHFRQLCAQYTKAESTW